MGKIGKRATVINHLIPLSITYLNKAFDLRWIGKRSKEIILHVSNPITGKKEITACIYIEVHLDTASDNDYIDLQYWHNGKLQKQRIELIAKKIKLTKGNEYFFRCPVSGNRRRKLYLYGGKFVCKQVIPNPHYQSQIQSKKQRAAAKEIKGLARLQDTIRDAQKKRSQKYYRGEPTKTYINILMAIDDLKSSW